MMDNCTLKELERRVHELDKSLSVHQTANAKDLQYIETALKLQATEYERRLQILNHEADQLKKMQATYLPRESWEETIRGLVSSRDQLIGRKDAITVVISIVTAGLASWIL